MPCYFELLRKIKMATQRSFRNLKLVEVSSNKFPRGMKWQELCQKTVQALKHPVRPRLMQ